MWFPITKGNSKRNRFSILEPVLDLRGEEYDRNYVAERDKNKVDENLELNDINTAFKQEINKNKNLIYKFTDLIKISSNIYGNMGTRAIALSSETIKKMDEALWDDIRQIYEKLKQNKEVIFLDLFKTVHKIIKHIYGSNAIETTLKTYNQNIGKAVFEIGKFLLSTYHEAYIIVTQSDKMLLQGNTFKDKAVQSENALLNDKQKTAGKCAAGNGENLNKMPLSKKKCNSWNVLSNKPGINYAKLSIKQTLMKEVGSSKNKIISDPKMKISPSGCLCFNASLKPNVMTNSVRQGAPKQNLSKIIEKDSDVDDDDSGVDVNYDDKASNSKDVTDILCSSEIHREQSVNILSLLKTNEQTQKKNKDEQDLTVQETNDTREIQEKVMVDKTKLDKIFSSLLSFLKRSLPQLSSNLQQILPNLIVMILFSIYKNSLSLTSNKLKDLINAFKVGIRDLLLRAATLLEN